MKKSTLNLSEKASARPVEAYWDCNLSWLEWLLLITALALSLVLHLNPILDSGKGKFVLVLLAAISFLSPFTGFFFIGASSVLPFPDPGAEEILHTAGMTGDAEIGTSPAKIGMIVWFIVFLIRYRRISLTGIGRLWPVIPWFLWIALITGDPIYLPQSEFMKVIIYSIMACQLANEARGKYLKCLLGLCLGALVVILAFWGVSAGLPIAISNFGAARGGMERIGSIRADAVMTWPAILMGLSGVIGVILTMASKASPVRAPRWLNLTGIILFIGSMPPLISTMTHGGYSGTGLLLVAFALSVLFLYEKGMLSGSAFNTLLIGSVTILLTVAILFLADAFEIQTRAKTMITSYKETAAEVGFAASRTAVWRDSINTIMQYPLLGAGGNHAIETITSEYAKNGAYLSHNVFLDAGRVSGIPGMLLVALFFFFPLAQAFSSVNWPRFLPFILFHFVMLIFWMSLSFWGYKTCWAFWMLMSMAVGESKHRRPAVKSRRKPQSPASASSS